jgi:putative effector of murein hydrolase
MQAVGPLFSHLLGYVTVALAIPLAAMRLDDLPLKKLSGLLLLATLMGALLPMGMAWLLHLSEPTVMAFATRAVTTPIALNIAALIDAPLALASLIVIVSGLIGAALSPLILSKLDDERAAGLALGLAAHAIGTVEAWQRGPVAGRYAAFGMAINGLITAIWVPLVF